MVGVHSHNSAHDNKNWDKIYDNLGWLTGLKLIQIEQQKTQLLLIILAKNLKPILCKIIKGT